MIPRRERQAAAGAVVLTVLAWASAFVGIRAAGRTLSPGGLALLRLAVGSSALGVLVLARRSALPSRRDIGNIVLCGLLWFGAYNVLLNQAERVVDAGTAAMLVNIGPILLAVLSGLFLGEGFPRRLLAGCAIAFAGVVVIGLATSTNGLRANSGALLCIAAAVAYAVGVTLEKPVLSRTPALTVTWLACTVAAVACLPFLPQLAKDLSHADAGTVIWGVYLGLVPTAMGFSLWAFALARTSAGRLGVTTYVVPPLTILMGWIALGDVPPGLAIAGGGLCLLGVAIVRTTGRFWRFGRPRRTTDIYTPAV